MDGFTARLAAHDLLAIDTAIFIYHFESHPRYCELTHLALDHIQRGRSQGVISVIALMELTVHPWRQQNSSAAQEYETLLVNFPNLALSNVDRSIARRAAQLRASHRLQPADALHLATALQHGATAFLTNDLRLRRAHDQIDIIVLDQFTTTSQ